MCCTFGDQADVAWWYTHHLPLIEAIDRRGRMTAACGVLEGLPLIEARKKVKDLLAERGEMLDRQPTRQSIRVHERCDTPVEYVRPRSGSCASWIAKPSCWMLANRCIGTPRACTPVLPVWVENLNWDWCISRQRYFGVAFPLWYCTDLRPGDAGRGG